MSAADDALVLVVDDDEEIRTLLARTLGADGFRIALAADAAGAVAAIAARPPDLVVLDLVLGGDDGLDLLDVIRRTND
ncbi:MAG: response regulator, partial [Acidimicrobiia bacterium]